MLIVAGADVNMPGERRNRPLYYAAQGGNTECLSTLMEAGARVNEATKCKSFVSLIDAAKRGHCECVRILIQAGANVNETNRTTNTTFFGAAFTRQYMVLNLLLGKGADINATDSNGYTALITWFPRMEML